MTESENSKNRDTESNQAPDTLIKSVLSIALIGPDDNRRKAFLSVLAECQQENISEFTSFPPDLDHLPQALGQHYDVVILDVDSDPDYVFDLVERISDTDDASVMVYSSEADVKQAVRFMRGGASEYFTLPTASSEVANALQRAATREPATPILNSKINGQPLVFIGAKGGCGVTSIAANFAVLLARVSSQPTLLIDFGLPLGDVGINLGMPTANYSTANVLQDHSRLDARFLQSLTEKYSSSLSVLSAPGDFTSDLLTREAIEKLLEVARQNYSYIVVDVGSRVDLMETKLFEDSSIVFLITQVGISELRNSNRMISRFFALRNRNLQIVLNRYTPKTLLFDDSQIAKALTRPANWKIPDDYTTARRTENTGTPIALEDSPIALALKQMALTVCGLTEGKDKNKKKGFSLFKK